MYQLPQRSPGAFPALSHPHFPANQIFVWLPWIGGGHLPYCSYNLEAAEDSFSARVDQNGAFLCNPYPVGSETCVAWNHEVSPPVPYHPLPLPRSLTRAEMTKLAEGVLLLLGEDPALHAEPLHVLNFSNKILVQAVLSEMTLSPVFTVLPDPGEVELEPSY